jgi:murein DD-endopeptidase MepM/ murein hydrolase activator NlpD
MRILAQTLAQRSRKRQRWLAAGTGAFMLGVVAAFGTVADLSDLVLASAVVERLSPHLSVAESSTGVYYRVDRFQRGDTFAALLDRIGVDDGEAEKLLRSPEGARAMSVLRPGATVQARTAEEGELLSLWFVSGKDRLVAIERAEGGFSTSDRRASLSRLEVMKSGEIRSSLFAATDAAGVPDGVAIQIADIFAGDVDFHRDLRRRDAFRVVYEQFHHDGQAVNSGRVLAAEFVNQNKIYRAAWFQDAEGKGGYYTPEGRNLRKAFLRSPLEFSRITSRFGVRHHPILLQWQAHRGVDYGAATGTRVKATGDGVVDFIGRQGGYGNMLVVRHAGGYMTAYGHLNRFAAGIRRGKRVSQGELIGYVGQTGWATGPHLHYEFRVNNQHRNPLAMSFPAANPVAPEKLAAFKAASGPLEARLDLLRTTNLALLE